MEIIVDFGKMGKSLWVLFGSNFAGFLLVICGFCFGGGGWWVMGSEAGVICLSFVAFLDNGDGGGFSGRETEEER